MEEKSHPDVASFLIRFVRDQSKAETVTTFRGLIRHIQTDSEQTFTCWEEVESFIQQVIPLEINNETKGVNHEVEG